MTRVIRVAALAGALLSAPSPARAVTIDFEAAIPAFTASYEEDGFLVLSDDLLLADDHLHFDLATFPTFNSQNGTTALGNHHYAMKVRRLDGGLFSFHSFDAAEYYTMAAESSGANNRTIVVKGSMPGGSTEWASFDLDFVSDGLGGLPDFESFVMPSTFYNVEQIEFFGTNGPTFRPNFYQLDNLRFDDAVVAPEPSAILLMGTGFVATWLRQQRRRSRRTNQTDSRR